jgi:hypothetical protein
MKWIKKGKIFDPRQYKLPNNCNEFAQSPQTLVFNDFVRIYFSTRSKEGHGQYLSHIAFIDMSIDLKNVLNVSSETIIGLGALGSFDEHGIFPISPFRDNNRLLAYTCGWSRRISVPVETAIGLAESYDNGLTFQKIGEGPILGPSIKEPFLVGDGFVRKFNSNYYMWYIFGTKWIPATSMEPAARVYKIGHATSGDGISWKKDDGKQIIKDVLSEDECQALPTVIKTPGKYHMFFCFREATDFRKNPERSYKLGYAYSDDLVTWTRDDDKAGIKPTKNEWDSDMMCYPHLFQIKNKTYLLYNGNEFGKYGFGLAELESEI